MDVLKLKYKYNQTLKTGNNSFSKVLCTLVPQKGIRELLFLNILMNRKVNYWSIPKNVTHTLSYFYNLF